MSLVNSLKRERVERERRYLKYFKNSIIVNSDCITFGVRNDARKIFFLFSYVILLSYS